MTLAYNPAAQFEIKEWDVEFRRTPARTLMARVYQPQGPGPFPTLLDLHGGAWHDKDRFANVPMCQAAAKSGVLVVAIDMRNSPEAPYPASVQDANYGVRWLKMKAREWKGDSENLGVLGSSSGGHVAELLGMRPRDPRYTVIPLPEAPALDATVAYVATRSPISDCHARYEHMVKTNRPEMVMKSKEYFDPWESIFEGNPALILERGEKVTLPPLLIMQGELDSNVPWQLQDKFAQAYRAAGGECELEIFEGCEHMWISEPGPQTDRAHEVLKAFIAKQLRAMRRAA
ncbi:MAG: alpha/beta hydrolase [Betaproteobacteria bacterium]|nr:alpha/beta hydrolase [Betaproteobacteria bacterium]